MIKVIAFDYGGVIEGVPNPDFLLNISKIIGIDPKICKEVYLENNYLVHIEGLSFEDLWHELLIKFNKIEKEEEIIKFLRIQRNKEINQDLINLIKTLREKGYKIGLLSNNSTKINEEIKENGLQKYFDEILISEDIGFKKPDPKAFNVLLKKFNIKPEELIFVDDSKSSLSSASIIGYNPILFIDNNRLKNDLRKLNVNL